MTRDSRALRAAERLPARAAGRLAVDERRAKVAELILQHRTYRCIAEQLGISKTQVGRDALAVRDEWRARFAESYEAHVSMEIAKLDALERTLWPQALGNGHKPDLHAVDRLLAIMQRRAKLMGLDRPQRIDARAQVTADLAVRSSINDELVRDNPERLFETLVVLRECGFLDPATAAALDAPPT